MSNSSPVHVNQTVPFPPTVSLSVVPTAEDVSLVSSSFVLLYFNDSVVDEICCGQDATSTKVSLFTAQQLGETWLATLSKSMRAIVEWSVTDRSKTLDPMSDSDYDSPGRECLPF